VRTGCCHCLTRPLHAYAKERATRPEGTSLSQLWVGKGGRTGFCVCVHVLQCVCVGGGLHGIDSHNSSRWASSDSSPSLSRPGGSLSSDPHRDRTEERRPSFPPLLTHPSLPPSLPPSRWRISSTRRPFLKAYLTSRRARNPPDRPYSNNSSSSSSSSSSS
jgi:hypothetical protein